jgi:multicomponent Na+:H+ antiporter subunit E
VLIRVTSTQQTGMGRVIYGNSITLTPGTITVDMEGDQVIVHALTQATADGVREGGMDRRVTALER